MVWLYSALTINYSHNKTDSSSLEASRVLVGDTHSPVMIFVISNYSNSAELKMG